MVTIGTIPADHS